MMWTASSITSVIRKAKGPGNLWGYNPISVARFDALYGRSGKPDPGRCCCDFGGARRRISCVIYAHVRLWASPQVKVSAALITWGEISKGFARSDAYGSVMQDWPSIVEAGFMDIMLPMNYKRELAGEAVTHAQFLASTAGQSGRFGVNVIDGEDLNSLDGTLRRRNQRATSADWQAWRLIVIAHKQGAGQRKCPTWRFSRPSARRFSAATAARRAG